MAEPTRYRLVIADDHPLFRDALREAVSGLFGEVEITEAGSFDDIVKLLERGGEIDLILPTQRSLEALAAAASVDELVA